MSDLGDLEDLDTIEALVGVSSTLTDGLDSQSTASNETRCAILRAMGHDVAEPSDAARALQTELAKRRDEVVSAVLVAWDGTAEIPVNCADGARWRLNPADLNDPARGEPTSGAVVDGKIPVADLAAGFHDLQVEVDGQVHESMVISAPSRVFDDGFADSRRWGLFAPTPSLWRRSDASAGTLDHLAMAAMWAAKSGASVIATLPMLAATPGDASPYSPLSRSFWDDQIVSFADFGVDEVEADMSTGQRDPVEDGRRTTAALTRLLATDEAAAKVAATTVSGDETISHYARFRAAQDAYGDDWRAWPDLARDGDLAALDLDETVVERHAFVQATALRQLGVLRDHLKMLGVDLYLDLPLGSNPRGYDHWCSQAIFAEGVQVGAPPDEVFSGGQAWGFAPVVPERARNDQHRDFRRSLEAHMRFAGILRLDHVMSLERLYWIVDDARDGVYVHQPLMELLAIVSVLSHRHRVTIVGENLGNVSDRIAEALADHGVAGMHVAQFAPAELPPSGSVASINTHDLPRFAAWWNGDDIDVMLELGLISSKLAADQHADRRLLTEQLAELAEAEVTTGDIPISVTHQMLERLGHSDAALVLLDIGDIWNERRPHNVPGTHNNHNWTFRAAKSLDDWSDDDRVLLETLNRARTEVSEAGSWPPPGWWFGSDDQHLFNEGAHTRLWHGLGARVDRVDGTTGVRFSVWAPNARSVHVVGEFNSWVQPGLAMRPIGSSGVWDCFLSGAGAGLRYKYLIEGAYGGVVEKADPLAFAAEPPPGNASIVAELAHEWGDDDWLAKRGERNRWDAPISIYEVHLGSWRRVPDEGDRHLTYVELIDSLVDHVASMGFTHVEFLPITEHPLYASWGYQTTGYFAATSRYGSPTELMDLIDAFHQADIGVILDWVPSHFPTDEFALNAFDGTQLYEHADPREGFHPDWKSSIFNYGRHEVRSFLLSSGRFWLEAFHIDGLRVDAVASMLYRDYSRGDDWIPNRYGGRENLEAVSFLQQLNHEMYSTHPDVMMIAEESTAWPGVTRSTDEGGLGFGFKWDMGWMNDTLDYFAEDPVHRRWHHNKLTFRAMYGFSENYVLPLSHDEVVHGKGSLLAKMPGTDSERFANLRLLFGWQYATPGKKLVFMGDELAQWAEWDHDGSLSWHLTEHPPHEGVLQWVAQLNRMYRDIPALHAADTSPAGFRWIDADDADRSILTLLRSDGRDDAEADLVVVALNATPIARHDVMVGVPKAGRWEVLACSDETKFGGAGYEQQPAFTTTSDAHADYPQALWLTLPGLSITFLRHIP